MLTNRILVVSLGVGVAIACAEAQDEPGDSPDTNTAQGGKSSGGQGAGVAGKLATAGSTAVSQGATSNAGGAGTSGTAGKGGAAGHAGSGGNANGGNAKGGSGGRAGAGSGGASGSGNGGVAGTATAGTSSGGSNTAGTGTTGLACADDAAAGAAAGGADAGAGGAAGALDLFFDDFESGAASKWTTTLGTWAVVDDGSKAYEQSAQENKLQIAVAKGACAVDQVIDAKLKVIAFKGQSNSYAAALYGRVLSPTTHYLLALGSDGKLALRKRVNSSSTGATAIGTAVTTTITAGQWYDVHFELIGTSLKGCLGAVCVTGTDSSIASGSVGVGTVNTSARFDDVRLTLP